MALNGRVFVVENPDELMKKASADDRIVKKNRLTILSAHLMPI
jgi:hypothetical protein